MKKLILCAALLSATSSFAQKNEALIKEIEENITAINQMIKFSNTRIAITAGPSKFDPADEHNFEKYTAYSEERVKRFFDSLSMQTRVVYPYNIITIDNDHFDLLALMGKSSSHHMDHPEEKPVYILQQITFLDGTKADATGVYCSPYTIRQQYATTDSDGDWFVDTAKLSEVEKWVWAEQSSFYESFVLYNPKPVKDISFSIALPLRSSTSDTLDLQHKTLNTPFGSIVLDDIKGNQVSFIIPAELGEQVEVKALYKDGRILSQKSYSSQTSLTEKGKAAFQQMITVLEEAKKKVRNGELKDQAAMEAYVRANAATEAGGLQEKTSLYQFAGPVSRVVFIRSDTSLKTRTQQVVYKVNYYKGETGYYVAADFETGKTGILNTKGKWVVKPEFDEYFRPQNAYYYWDQIDDHEATYWLDHKTETLHKVAYRVDDPELYAGKYMKIEPKVNGNIGLVDVTTGKEVLPMQHDFLRLVGDRYWNARIGDNEGVYNTDFSVLIPFAFNDVNYIDGYFYTRTEDNKEDVYNLKGQNITHGKYQDIDGYFGSGLLLVETYTIGTDRVVNNNKKFFIDTLGKIKITLKDIGMSDAEPFSSGLAKVRHAGTDKYGYINAAGKLVLPCVYTGAHDFFEKSEYALVEEAGGAQMLIDKKGQVIKKLSEHYQSIYRDKESGLFHIRLYNGKTYDEYGKQVTEK